MSVENSQLLKSLGLLASSPEEQKSYLIELGAFPYTDELALEFDDTYHLWKSAEDHSIIDIGILYKVEKLNLLFDNMSDNAGFSVWHVDSLQDLYWSEIRQLSAEISYELGITIS